MLKKSAQGDSVKVNVYDKFVRMLDNIVSYTNLIFFFLFLPTDKRANTSYIKYFSFLPDYTLFVLEKNHTRTHQRQIFGANKRPRTTETSV